MERQVFHAFVEGSPVIEIAGELGRFFDVPFCMGFFSGSAWIRRMGKSPLGPAITGRAIEELPTNSCNRQRDALFVRKRPQLVQSF